MSTTAGDVGGPGREQSAFWGGPFVMGLLVAILGVVAIASAGIAGVTSVMLLAILIGVSGIIELVHALRGGQTGRRLVFLLGGLFSLFVGVVMFLRPIVGLASLTLLVGAYFLVNGLFRTVTSLVDRYARWGWDLTYGIVAIVLGVIVMGTWPMSAFWVLGTLVGVELLVRGLALMSLSLRVRRLARLTS